MSDYKDDLRAAIDRVDEWLECKKRDVTSNPTTVHGYGMDGKLVYLYVPDLMIILEAAWRYSELG